MKLTVALGLLITFTTAAYAQRVSLACLMESQPHTELLCNGWGFPFVVPKDRWFCVTDHILVNKFPYDPPEYGTRMRTMYFILPGLSVAAHHPQISLITPIAYPPNFVYSASIINGMSEAQNIYGIVTGFLSYDSDCFQKSATNVLFNISGNWFSKWNGGNEIESVNHTGIIITVISPSSGMASGTIVGTKVAIPNWNISGEVSADGKKIDWSNGALWTKQ